MVLELAGPPPQVGGRYPDPLGGHRAQAPAPRPDGAAAAAQGHLLGAHGAWRRPAQKHHGHLSILLWQTWPTGAGSELMGPGHPGGTRGRACRLTRARRRFQGPQLLSKIWGLSWGEGLLRAPPRTCLKPPT